MVGVPVSAGRSEPDFRRARGRVSHGMWLFKPPGLLQQSAISAATSRIKFFR